MAKLFTAILPFAIYSGCPNAGESIKELEDSNGKKELVRSLRKGNAQQVTVDRDGSEQKYFMAANPQYKTVDLYDHQMKKIKKGGTIAAGTKGDKKFKTT